ncbi:hypothetical protein [Enterococcus phage vB_Efs30_KEN14]
MSSKNTSNREHIGSIPCGSRDYLISYKEPYRELFTGLNIFKLI